MQKKVFVSPEMHHILKVFAARYECSVKDLVDYLLTTGISDHPVMGKWLIDENEGKWGKRESEGT